MKKRNNRNKISIIIDIKYIIISSAFTFYYTKVLQIFSQT